jgi:hypothetical protein
MKKKILSVPVHGRHTNCIPKFVTYLRMLLTKILRGLEGKPEGKATWKSWAHKDK